MGVGGLAALANKDCWQARPRLTLTYHVMFVFKQKAKKNLSYFRVPISNPRFQATELLSTGRNTLCSLTLIEYSLSPSDTDGNSEMTKIIF